MQTQELERIENVTVTQSGEQFTAEQKLLEQYRVTSDLLTKELDHMFNICESLRTRATNAQNEVDRLTTVLLQESINKTNATQVRGILLKHLSNMLAEHEGIFARFGYFESYEFAEEYIEAAKAAKHLGRTTDFINEVEEWMKSDNSLPYKKRAS